MLAQHRIWNSISGLRSITLLVILAAFVLSVVLVFRLVDDYHDLTTPDTEASIERDLEMRSKAVNSALQYSREIILSLSRQPELVDLVDFGSVDMIVAWAIESRRYLPYSTGLALIKADGSIIGDPDIQHVGGACLLDIESSVSGQQLPWPRVHLADDSHRHYDIMVPVIAEDGDISAYLFASYRIEMLLKLIRQYTSSGEHMQIVDSFGNRLAEAGELAANARGFTRRIGDSQLELTLSKRVSGSQTLYSKVAVFLIGFLLLIVILLLLVTRRIIRLMRRDLEQVSITLDSIMNDEHGDVRIGNAGLHETSEIMQRISKMSQQLADRQNQLQQDSRHDALTGLPNRRYLDEYLERICNLVDRGIGFRLAIIDFDLFKLLNERSGKQAGDRLLQQFSYSVKGVSRAADFACRYTGDKFCVIYVELDGGGSSLHALERLAQAFRKSQQKEPVADEPVTLSIGTVYVAASSSPVADEVLRKADEALFEAKFQGRGRVMDYDAMRDAGGDNPTALQLVQNKKPED